MATTRSSKPKGLTRWLLRLPIWLYRLRLGWILRERFLLLTHRGRKSGLRRRTVLEVVEYDSSSGVYVVASGWGEKSDWFQNILKEPNVNVTVGRRNLRAKAVRMSLEQAADSLCAYARQHPSAFRALSKGMVGHPLRANRADCLSLAESVPLVGLFIR